MKIGEYIKFIKQADMVNANFYTASPYFSKNNSTNNNANNDSITNAGISMGIAGQSLPYPVFSWNTTTKPANQTFKVSDSFNVQPRPSVKFVSQLPPENVANFNFAASMWKDMNPQQQGIFLSNPTVNQLFQQNMIPKEHVNDIARMHDVSKMLLAGSDISPTYKNIIAHIPLTIKENEPTALSIFNTPVNLQNGYSIPPEAIRKAYINNNRPRLGSSLHEAGHINEYLQNLVTQPEDTLAQKELNLVKSEHVADDIALNKPGITLNNLDISPETKQIIKDIIADDLYTALDTYHASYNLQARDKWPTLNKSNVTIPDEQLLNYVEDPNFQRRFKSYTGTTYDTGLPVEELNLVPQDQQWRVNNLARALGVDSQRELLNNSQRFTEKNVTATNLLDLLFRPQHDTSRAWYNSMTPADIRQYATPEVKQTLMSIAQEQGLPISEELRRIASTDIPINWNPTGPQMASSYFSQIPTGGYKPLPGLPEGLNTKTPINNYYKMTPQELYQTPNHAAYSDIGGETKLHALTIPKNMQGLLDVGGDVLIGADMLARGIQDTVSLPEKSHPRYGKMSWAERNAARVFDKEYQFLKNIGYSDSDATKMAGKDSELAFYGSVIAGSIPAGINRIPQMGLDYTVKAPTDLYNLFQSAKEYVGFTPTYLKSLDGNTHIDTDKVTLYNLLGGDIGGSWGQAYNAVGQGVANTVQIPFNFLYNTVYQTPKDLITGPDPPWAKDQTRYFRPDIRAESMQKFENIASKWKPEQQEAVYSNIEQSVQQLGNAIETLKQRIANNQKRNTTTSKQQLEQDMAQFKEKRLRWDNLQLSLAVLRKLNPTLGTEPAILNPDYFPNLPEVDDYSTAASAYQDVNQKAQQALQEVNKHTPTIDNGAINSEIDAMLEEDEDPYAWMPKRM